MTRRRFLFDTPDRFVAGTVGEPGSRVFFLQAREGARIVSVALEKVQVAALAQRLDELLDELDRRGIEGAAELPEEEALRRGDTTPLDEPINEAFRAGTLSLGWDTTAGLVLIEARAVTDDEEDEDDIVEDPSDDDAEGPDFLRVRVTAAAARAFVERAIRVLASGRPPCPLCGQPLDQQGHLCPRRNGHLLN